MDEHDEQWFNQNHTSVENNTMETEDSLENGGQSKSRNSVGFGVPVNSPFEANQPNIKKETAVFQETNDVGFSNCLDLDHPFDMPCENGDWSQYAHNSPVSSSVNIGVNNEDPLNVSENFQHLKNPVPKARRGRGRWRKENNNDSRNKGSSPTIGSQRGRGRGRGIRRGCKKNSISEPISKIDFSPSVAVAIKEEATGTVHSTVVAEEPEINLSQSDFKSNILKIQNRNILRGEPVFKARPRPYHSVPSVPRRSRGTNRFRASVCKNGLLCRQHDVLAPVSMMVDNCLNSLNIPYFAPIQLMNYGDEIFEAEMMHQNSQKHEENGINDLGDLESLNVDDANSNDSGGCVQT